MASNIQQNNINEDESDTTPGPIVTLNFTAVAQNPNVTWNAFYPDPAIPWNWEILSRNTNITWNEAGLH